MIEYYEPIETRYEAKYQCPCGHKFKRINKTYYTRNPFNHHSDSACRSKNYAETRTMERKCPKCGTLIKPILTFGETEHVKQALAEYDENDAIVKAEGRNG